jgi:hypothetical protein
MTHERIGEERDRFVMEGVKKLTVFGILKT